MPTTIQATDLRRRVREVLERVRTGKDPVIVRTYDTPQAVLIPYDDYADYQAWRVHRQQTAAWLDELQAIAQEVSARAALSQGEADALIEEAVEATRGA